MFFGSCIIPSQSSINNGDVQPPSGLNPQSINVLQQTAAPFGLNINVQQTKMVELDIRDNRYRRDQRGDVYWKISHLNGFQNLNIWAQW